MWSEEFEIPVRTVARHLRVLVIVAIVLVDVGHAAQREFDGRSRYPASGGIAC